MATTTRRSAAAGVLGGVPRATTTTMSSPYYRPGSLRTSGSSTGASRSAAAVIPLQLKALAALVDFRGRELGQAVEARFCGRGAPQTAQVSRSPIAASSSSRPVDDDREAAANNNPPEAPPPARRVLRGGEDWRFLCRRARCSICGLLLPAAAACCCLLAVCWLSVDCLLSACCCPLAACWLPAAGRCCVLVLCWPLAAVRSLPPGCLLVVCYLSALYLLAVRCCLLAGLPLAFWLGLLASEAGGWGIGR